MVEGDRIQAQFVYFHLSAEGRCVGDVKDPALIPSLAGNISLFVCSYLGHSVRVSFDADGT